MILPQFRQLGAGVKRGCRVAWQEHFLFWRGLLVVVLLLVVVEREGLVVCSSWAMAAVRSAMSDVVDVVVNAVVDMLRFREGEASVEGDDAA